MKKNIWMSLSFVASISLLTACGQSDIEKQNQPQEQNQTGQNKEGEDTTKKPENEGEVKKSQAELIQDKLNLQDQKIKELTNEVDYYRVFVKDFTSTFTTEQMDEFVEKEWNYKLEINNINFPKNGVLELSDTSFDLVVTEDKVPFSVIPDEMSLKGKLEGGINGKVSVLGDIKYETKEAIDTESSVITYSFKDIPMGTVLKMTISDSLKKELKMDSNELEIHIE